MEGTSTASATVKLLEAATPEIVGAVGGAAKATFNATADVIERVFKGREREEPQPETVPLMRQQSSNGEDTASEDEEKEQPGFIERNFGSNGRVTMIVESVPAIGQVIAGTQLLSGHTREAKRALAKSTKSTVMGTVAAGAALTGGAVLGAYGATIGLTAAAATAVGLYGGAVAGSAAGEIAGGASQALVEATVYDEADRRATGTEYLHRSPAQWTAGVAIASAGAAAGAGVGALPSIAASTLKGSVEVKVAGELAETVAQRTVNAVAPVFKRTASKRRRELARLDAEAHDAGIELHDTSGPPMARRTRSRDQACSNGGYGAVPMEESPPRVRRTRSREK